MLFARLTTKNLHSVLLHPPIHPTGINLKSNVKMQKKNELKEKHCKRLLYLQTLIFFVFIDKKKKSLQKQIFSKQVSLQVLHPFDVHVSIHLGFA